MTIWGVHMDQGYFSTSEHQAELEAARSKLGVSLARHTMIWRNIEGTQDVFNWSVYDSIISKSEAMGVDSMFMLATSPNWSRGGVGDLYTVPDAGSGVTATFQTWAGHYADFCAEAVNRYKPGGTYGSAVRYWEVWNEPNLWPSFWKGGGANDPDQYAYLYDLAYAAIIAADPGAMVGFGVTVEWEAAYGRPARTFLDDVLAASGVNGPGGRVIDNFSVHTYCGVGSYGPPYLHLNLDQNMDDVAEMRRWLIDNGLPDVPIWITEFGWDSDTTSLSQQAIYTRDFLKLFKRRYIPDLGVDIIVAFSYKDGLGGSNHGLLDTNLDLKLAGDEWVDGITSGSDIAHGPAGVRAKVVNLALPTSTGQHSYTGVGFKPKAFIAFCTGLTADGAGDGNVGSFGVSDVIISRVMSWSDTDGVSPTASHTAINDALIRVTDSAGTELAEATILTADDDGFTLNVSTAGAAYATTILCIGGEDITRSTVADVEWNPSDTGTWYMTEPGFVPDFLLNAWTYQGISAYPSTSANALWCIGVTDMTDQQLLAVESVAGLTTTSAARRHSSTRISGSVYGDGNVAFVSRGDSGVIVNRVSATGTSTTGFFLALKGGRWKVGQETQGTTTGAKSTALPFPPVGMFVMSHVSATPSVASSSNWVSSFGASDGSTEGSCGYASQAFVATSNTGCARSSSKGVLMTGGSAPFTSTVAAGDVTFDNVGFSVDWTTADSTARVFSYVAFGDAERSTDWLDPPAPVSVAVGSSPRIEGCDPPAPVMEVA